MAAVLNTAYARKNRAEEFKSVARAITPWLRRLVTAYKKRGVFPVTPAILGDFYKEYNNKVAATLIGCLCLNTSSPEAIMAEAQAMRRQMGAHPWKDFIVGRKFVLMSLADVLGNSIGGMGSMKYWQVARLCESLYETYAEGGGKTLEEIFRRRVTVNGMAPVPALGSMVNMKYVRRPEYRLNLALTALCGRDGISYRLWNPDGIEERMCVPVDNTVSKFANILMPGYKGMGFTIEDVADMVGLERPLDLWYACYGYMELVSRDMGTCGRYMRRYHTQLKGGRSDYNNRYQLRRLEPKIRF